MSKPFGLLGVLFLFAVYGAAMAQHEKSDYIPVKDPEVQSRLENWQDLKFGLFMHWGPYSQWGVVESWSICNEDWIKRSHGRCEDYGLYKEDYRNLKKTFNPSRFDPDKWADAALKAGMRYLVFTTKHHDGFCMFDTHLTDYKITSKECPFHTHEKANITFEIFEAFRKKEFLIGAYFSKPDWNCADYWWPYYATPDRHVNYDPARHPERWDRFKAFTYEQIEELMTGYGRMDVLWLDGAWVRPIENMPEAFESWAKKNDYDQNIDMARIARMARKHQPGLIIVDRWVAGEYENYLTPEQRVPDHALNVPWESCITMAQGWSYNSNHTYKPVRKLIHLLVEIVAKGGNLLLNIGPSPEGDWADEAYDRLAGIGAWMDVNNEAIHGTRPMEPYSEGRIRLTQKKDGSVYAIYLGDEDEDAPPETIALKCLRPAEHASVTLLGFDQTLDWKKTNTGFEVNIPDIARKDPPCRHAWVLKISALE